MLLGVDVGYHSTKTHKGDVILSAISKKTNTLCNNKIIVDGQNYNLGYGLMTSDMDKIDSDINKVMSLYMMAKYNSRETLLALGLPVGQYEHQKDRLRETVLSYNQSKVKYNGEDYRVNIKDVIVTPQGIAALYTLSNLYGDYIVIDIGGGTIDISYVSFSVSGAQIIKTETLYKGTRTVYTDILNAVNNEYQLKLTEQHQAEKLIKVGLHVDGVQKDLSIIKPVLQEYVDSVTDDIKTRYPYRTTPIYLVGGGAELLYNPLTKRLPTVNKIVNAQFANAVGSYNLGRVKFMQRGYRVE